jgi:hypothetical protein
MPMPFRKPQQEFGSVIVDENLALKSNHSETQTNCGLTAKPCSQIHHRSPVIHTQLKSQIPCSSDFPSFCKLKTEFQCLLFSYTKAPSCNANTNVILHKHHIHANHMDITMKTIPRILVNLPNCTPY